MEIAARRRNGRKSRGPRTPAGRRRAALNLLCRQLCPKQQEERLAAQGADPREFRRFCRHVILLVARADWVLDRLTAHLARELWEKLHLLRRQPHTAARESRLGEIDRSIQIMLARLVMQLMFIHPRVWYGRLTSSFGPLISSPADLQERIESGLLRTWPMSNGQSDREFVGEKVNVLKTNGIMESVARLNLALVSCVLSRR